jgi:hypothetical protein
VKKKRVNIVAARELRALPAVDLKHVRGGSVVPCIGAKNTVPCIGVAAIEPCAS